MKRFRRVQGISASTLKPATAIVAYRNLKQNIARSAVVLEIVKAGHTFAFRQARSVRQVSTFTDLIAEKTHWRHACEHSTYRQTSAAVSNTFKGLQITEFAKYSHEYDDDRCTISSATTLLEHISALEGTKLKKYHLQQR